jgi:uncharacterized membrane protein YtjA (UPF0391 family)
MLKWAGVFFLIAIAAAIFGFTGILAGASSVGKVFFYVFLFLLLLFAVIGVTEYRKINE